MTVTDKIKVIDWLETVIDEELSSMTQQGSIEGLDWHSRRSELLAKVVESASRLFIIENAKQSCTERAFKHLETVED